MNPIRPPLPALVRLPALVMLCGAGLLLANNALAEQATPCQLWSSDNHIDYEPRTKEMLAPAPPHAAMLSFGQRTMLLSVSCDKPTRFALSFQGPGATPGAFGFGAQGRLQLRLENAQLDGHPVPMVPAAGTGNPNREASYSLAIQPGERVVMAPDNALQGKQWSAQLRLEPLVPSADARVSGRTQFDGDISIQLMSD